MPLCSQDLLGHAAQDLDALDDLFIRRRGEVQAERRGRGSFVHQKGVSGDNGNGVLLHCLGAERRHVAVVRQGAPQEQTALRHFPLYLAGEVTANAVCHEVALPAVYRTQFFQIGVHVRPFQKFRTHCLCPDVGVPLCHEKIRNQRKDFQHKLSTSLAESYDAVCVEDLNLKGMAGGFHFGKGVHDNGYGLFLSMLEYKLEERGKYLIKVDRYFASSKICSVCGKKKEELSLSDRIYYCECGNRMDRDVNAAVNIMNEGKRIFAECA